MEQLYVVKIGGQVIDEEQALDNFLEDFAALEGKKILVHGGGKLATRMAERLGIPQQMVDGRRITDAETLKLATMVYAGYINKNIVAHLQALSCNAIGLSGADANLVPATKRPVKQGIDFGFVGDIEPGLSTAPWLSLLHQDLVPVLAAITHDGRGQLLNTNADTLAQEVAKALSKAFSVNLIYLFEKPGVLRDVTDNDSFWPALTFSDYEAGKAAGTINKGMIPKLDNAFTALKDGVGKVAIGQAKDLNELAQGLAGTSICHE